MTRHRHIIFALLVVLAAIAAAQLVPRRIGLTALTVLPLVVGAVLPRGRDARREAEQQAAFEEAERTKAERRASLIFYSFVDTSPAGVELFSSDGKALRSNKAAERLLGKVPPPGIPIS